MRLDLSGVLLQAEASACNTDTTQTQTHQISNTPVLQPATRTPLKPKRTKSPTHLCFSLQHGHHSNPAAPNLQHTCASACNTDTTQTQTHQISNTPVLQPATRTPLKPSRTKSPTHLCFSLQHGHHSNPTAPNLQHTTNREKNDRCGNSTAQSQAPDDGYINVRNILST